MSTVWIICNPNYKIRVAFPSLRQISHYYIDIHLQVPAPSNCFYSPRQSRWKKKRLNAKVLDQNRCRRRRRRAMQIIVTYFFFQVNKYKAKYVFKNSPRKLSLVLGESMLHATPILSEMAAGSDCRVDIGMFWLQRTHFRTNQNKHKFIHKRILQIFFFKAAECTLT